MIDLLTLLTRRWARLRGDQAAGEAPPSEKQSRLRRLEKWQDGEAALTDADIHFWAERFQRLAVRGRAGCSFERYLRRPIYYERIARARRIIQNKNANSSHEHDHQSGHTPGGVEGTHVSGRGA